MADRVSVQVSVEGAKAIDDQLAQLPILLRGRVLQRAVTRVTRVGRDAARRQTPVASGVLRKAVAAKVVEKREVVIGIVGTGRTVSQAYLVEYGHRMVMGGTIPSGRNNRVRAAKDPARTGQGRVVGEVAPQPWFRPAFDATAPQIERILLEELGKLVEEIRR